MPKDTHARLLAILDLVIERLDIPPHGQDLAFRLGWARDPGAYATRRPRMWIDERKKPPKQFADLLHMLGEAGLLQPEAEAAWRGVSLEEAAEAVRRARDQADEAESNRALDALEESPQDERQSA